MPNTVLDVDETILKSKLHMVELSKEEEDFNKILESIEKPEIPCITFTPFPGICVKTRTDAGDKVFINLCHTSEIPPPEDISDEKFLALLDEETPSWVIPMSVGHERYENSKQGVACLTYDIAINTTFFKKIETQEHFLVFVILTMISAIESKHNKTLNSKDYIILKNKKVCGTLHEHRVQKRAVRKPVAPKPLIEEISDDEKAKLVKKNMSDFDKKQDNVEESEYVIFKHPKDGNAEKLIAYFKLPNQCSQADVHAGIGEDRIVVDVDNHKYLVDVFVPFNIKQDQVTAFLDQHLQVLRLEMPVGA